MSSIRERFGKLLKRRKKDSTKESENLDKRLVFGLSAKRMPSTKQLKHLSKYLSKKELLVIRLLTAVILISVIALGYRYSMDHIVTVPSIGGTYTEASVGGPRFVNPVLVSANDTDLDIIKLVFSGLMRTDVNGELVADLADSYSVSEDGLTYTFTLRQGVQWHDGTAFIADDVVATIRYITHPAWNSPLATRFRNVQVEAVDPYTVIFTLPEPFAPFLSMLTVGIIPDHLWKDIKAENAALAELNLKPIGTGPYRFKNFVKDKKGAIRSYTLERNDGYYAEAPHLEEVTFRYFTDISAAVAAYTERKVDGLSFLPLEFRETVEEMQIAKIHTLRLPQYTALFFNPVHNGHLESKRVRQALALAVDRERILSETLGDRGVPVHGPILPGFVGFHPEIKKYQFDLDAADRLLTEAGWKIDEEDGLRKKNLPDPENDDEIVPTPLTVTITTVDTKENMNGAQIVKQGWESLGVVTELEIIPSSKAQTETIRPRAYDVLLYGEIIGPDPDPYPFWHSSQLEETGLNLSNFANSVADQLLEKARSTNDLEERAEYYRQFQDILAEEVPALFLYSPTYTYVVNRKVKGVEAPTIFAPADRFTGIQKWYIETERAWQ